MLYLSVVACLVLPLAAQPAEVAVEAVDAVLPSEAVVEKSSETGLELEGADRDEKFLSVFQIVKFKNGACPASNGDTGVCFTEAECVGRGGMASGSCASGFGVCCAFTLSQCGDTVTNNNTYIQSPGYPGAAPSGMCMYNLNKCDNNICQFRLEFEDVEVGGPAMGDCNNDTIIISNVDATSMKVVPILCGVLSGQHMIVDVKNQSPGAKITFNIIQSMASTRWRVKVIQLSCSDPELLAPKGCLTYDMGTSGSLMSYNNQGGLGEIINNQCYTHCIKCQEGFCDVSLTASTFDLGTGDTITFGANQQTGQNFGTMNSLLWNMTGPSYATACFDGANPTMNVGYNIGYMLLPC